MGATANSDYRDGNSKINKMYLGTSLIYARSPEFGIFTGGNISYTGDYKVHTFLSSGDFVIVEPGNYDLEYLIVGGGGGGGDYIEGLDKAGGGGGGGGFVSGYISSDILNSGTYTITVGAGGLLGVNGGNSSFYSIVAYGGGRGGSGTSSPNANDGKGFDGGCGGGGGSSHNGSITRPGGVGLQGFNGGSGCRYNYVVSGGGGGAGAGGQNGMHVATKGGNGKISSITGISAYYAGGGTGVRIIGSTIQVETGSLGGGGGQDHPDGYPNTGGGGAGHGYYAWSVLFPGGSGGSGIVIIRYKYK